ncbi:MAG: bifunctional DNA primase/polymerase [Candidatus Omnitrophota bacterium]
MKIPLNIFQGIPVSPVWSQVFTACLAALVCPDEFLKGNMNQNLSAALKYFREYNFCVIPWKNITSKGEKKSNKVPIIKWIAYQKKMCTENEIMEWWTKTPDANVGIVTGIVSKLVVFDTDDEEADKYFQTLLPDSLICPIVATPSGGRHYYFKSEDITLTNASKINGKKLDVRANGGFVGCPPSSNGSGRMYSFLKNLSIKDISLPLLPENLLILIKDANKHIDKETKDLGTSIISYKEKEILFTEGRRNEDLFHIANCLTRGSAKLYEKVQVLEILARNCNPPYPESEIQTIIESALNRKTRGEGGLTEEIKSIITYQDGIFSVSDAIKEYQIYQNVSNVSNSIKSQFRVILKRLKDAGVIERYGHKAGVYRVVNKDINKIDFLNASDENVPLKWPFGIEKHALLYPGNICIVAGTSNAGKTALLLNFVNMNMNKFKIRYQSSEMGGSELKRRLSFFSTPLKEFEKVEWIDRAIDWWDLVEPEAINIIDYMEIHEEHYKISGWIKKIFDKLTTGIAILALQKPAGRQLGVGGSSTLDKSRLYLSVDFDKITMVKAKNWATNINPNGLFISYELHQGIHFTSDSTWKKEG